MIELLWLLLPVAAASGWWAASREQGLNREVREERNAEYFRGLTYLLEDKPDKAIEVFIRMVEIDRDTAETHLTLGNLFRRRGEVDRAIHIHRNLIARTNLTPEQRIRAMQELGEDYVRAGLYDRAESLYQDLAEQPEHAEPALERLANVYQQERDWQQAITCCERLEHLTGVSRRREVAHFYCELAEEALQADQVRNAETLARQALARDTCCVRASILLGRMALEAGQHRDAIQLLQRVEHQNPRYLSEVVPLLQACYEALGEEAALLEYLRRIQSPGHSGLLAAALAELLQRMQGSESALEFVREELARHPSFKVVSSLIELRLARNEPLPTTDVDMLVRAARVLLDASVRYRCDNCGFSGKVLHWRCPGCQAWGSTRPLPDIVQRET